MMEQQNREEGLDGSDGVRVIVGRPLWERIAIYGALGLLALVVIAVVLVWIERRPIASHFLKNEFEKRGVSAKYHLDKIGFRTQQVSNLVIGDPKHPDLVAKRAIIQMRPKLNGSFEVYRVVARGVRLRGKLVHGKVSWGEIDKLLPPPSNKPFALPNIVVDVADSSISLATPFGPAGLAVQGNGNLSGGFKGRVAVSSPRLTPGKCTATDLHANLAVSITARHPSVDGPVALDRFACPQSNIEVDAPRVDAKATFNEAFTHVDGSGRLNASKIVAGTNALAGFNGNLSYQGALDDVHGHVKLAAQKSRLAAIVANRTVLEGDYALNGQAGNFSLVGGFNANSATLPQSMLASVVQPLRTAAGTPIGPITTQIGQAMQRVATNFDVQGHIKLVNFPGGGAVRVSNARIEGPQGAHASIAGGSGVTYYWPRSALRLDANLEMGGGGLPSAQVRLQQSAPGAQLSGVANLAPYSAGGQRISLAPIHFGPGPGGSTAVSTVALLDGSFVNGQVRGLRLPINGRLGPNGAFAVGTGCALVSFDYLKISGLQLNGTRLPICPVGPAIAYKPPNGSLVIRARVNSPSAAGHLGSSLLRVSADSALINGKHFELNSASLLLGKPESPIRFEPGRFSGDFAGAGVRGSFTSASGKVGNVPLLLSDSSGQWSFSRSILNVNAAATVSDDNPDPRFYPLRTKDLNLRIAGDRVTANGSLRAPNTGTLVTNVDILHHLSTGSGQANLDVPGIAFGKNLQPEQLTRLTEGVVAIVSGTVLGHGQINWSGNGQVASTGDFSTRNMDLAAPFGPVTGLTTGIHFTDLLNLETAPHQIATVASVNPGIEVVNGQIGYQILPHNLVKIERGVWPFMGGRLILHETVLNFGSPSPKRLTFELQGFNAKMFVDSLGFQGIEITGTFDGVLPMVFDDSGGRLVGGRLESRAPGGVFRYTGTKPSGLAPGVAFDLFSNIRYRSMIIRLNGDLAGEFATNLTIEGPSLGPSHGLIAGLVHRVFSQIPIRLNVNILGPFRALIQTAKAFKDPTQAIAPVMPFPIDSPALDVQVISTTKHEEQTTSSGSTSKTTTTNPPPPGGTK